MWLCVENPHKSCIFVAKIQPKVQQNNQTHIIPFSVLPTYFYKASIIPFGEYWDTISTDVLRSLYNSGCISGITRKCLFRIQQYLQLSRRQYVQHVAYIIAVKLISHVCMTSDSIGFPTCTPDLDEFLSEFLRKELIGRKYMESSLLNWCGDRRMMWFHIWITIDKSSWFLLPESSSYFGKFSSYWRNAILFERLTETCFR